MDSPMHTTPTAPDWRAREMANSRSSSKAGSARCAWLSRKSTIRNETAALSRGGLVDQRLAAPAGLGVDAGLGALPCDDVGRMSVPEARGHLYSIQIRIAPAT